MCSNNVSELQKGVHGGHLQRSWHDEKIEIVDFQKDTLTILYTIFVYYANPHKFAILV